MPPKRIYTWEELESIYGPRTTPTVAPKQTRQSEARGGSDTSFRDLPGNILPSAGRAIKDISSAVAHPVQTAKALGAVGMGVAEKILGDKRHSEEPADRIGQFFKDRYGSLDSVKQTFINDPVGFLLDASVVLGGTGAALKGAGVAGKIGALEKAGSVVSKVGRAADPLAQTVKLTGKAASKTLEGVGNLGAKVTGLTTTRGSEVIKTAFQAGKTKSPDFVKALRTEGEKAKIVDDFRDALGTLNEQRGAEYRSRLAEISKNTEALDISPVKKTLETSLEKFGVTKTDNGYDFSRSPITNPSDQQKVLSVISDIEGWGTKAGDRTATGIDILKRRVGDYITEGGQARALIKGVQGEVDTILKTQVEGYKDMVKGYAQSSELIDEIETTFSLGGKAKTESAINKMLGALREDKELRTSLVKQLEQKAGVKITDKIAGAALNDWLPPSLVGRGFAAGGVSGSILSPKFVIGAAVGLATLSPRLVGEVVRGLGLTARQADNLVKMVGSIKKKVPGIGKMSPQQIEQAIFQAGRAGNVVKPKE